MDADTADHIAYWQAHGKTEKQRKKGSFVINSLPAPLCMHDLSRFKNL